MEFSSNFAYICHTGATKSELRLLNLHDEIYYFYCNAFYKPNIKCQYGKAE